MKPNVLQSIFFVLASGWLATPAIAGGNNCSTIASGNWSDPAIWDCSGGTAPPGSSDFVTIENTHVVLLDINAVVNNIVVAAGGDLDVGAGSRTLSWDEAGSDLSNASIDLMGNFTIDASGGVFPLDFALGSIDGNFNVTINNNGNTQFNGIIGGSSPVASLTTDAAGTSTLAANITTVVNQTFNDPVVIAGDVTLDAPTTVSFASTVDADVIAGDRNLSLLGFSTTQFAAEVGGLTPLNNITSNGFVEMNGVGGTTVTTTADQSYQSSLTLNGDTTLNSTSNGRITIRNSSGPHHLVINTGGDTFFTGSVGFNRHLSVTTDALGTTRMSGSASVQVDGAAPTVCNDPVRIGASGRIRIDQAGAGDIIFNDQLASISGSPHEVTINDVSGATRFNGPVNIGELTTNDGAGDDVTVINAPSIIANQGGADAGTLTFNDPVQVLVNTAFSETGAGRVVFNNSLDAAPGAANVNLTFDTTDLVLQDIGSNSPFATITAPPGGSIELNGNVTSTGNQNWNDALTLNQSVTLTGSNITISEAVNLQDFELMVAGLNAAIAGVISGTGDLASDLAGDLTLTADNTFSGSFRVLNGTLDLGAAPNNNNISAVRFLTLSPGTTMLPNGASQLFELANSQSLRGDGFLNGNITTLAGSNISPGNQFGRVTTNLLDMNGGSELRFEINGNSAGVTYDQLTVQGLNLDADAMGTTELEMTTFTTVNIGDQFTLVDNQSIGPIVGTFQGIPEGGTFTNVVGDSFVISYQGGDGNDLVATAACTNTAVVSNNADAGAGSLRQAVIDVCDNGNIRFDADHNIVLTSEIIIDKEVSIDGGNTDEVLSGGGTTRLFNIQSGAELQMTRVFITDGFDPLFGGAIFNDGRLQISSSELTNNRAPGGGLGGGAIYSSGNAETSIDMSLFIGNESSRGGAIFIDIANTAAMTQGGGPATNIGNSTFTQNGTTSIEGGAIHNRGLLFSLHNTVAENGQAGTTGGGVYTWNGDLRLFNTLVADNLGAQDCFIETSNSTQSNDSSLIETGNCDAALTDDPQLQPLADNGGPTRTMALGLQSPAVDVANEMFCPTYDQRDTVTRPQFNGCDIGAYELEVLGTLRVNQNPVPFGVGSCAQGSCWENPFITLQDALAVAPAGASIWVAQGTYRPDEGGAAVDGETDESFVLPPDTSLYGGFNGTELTVDERNPTIYRTILSGDIDQDDVDTDGNQIAETAADIVGFNTHHVLRVAAPGNYLIDGLVVTAGSATGKGAINGGGLRCDAPFGATLRDTVWSGNEALDDGGAVYLCQFNIERSRFVGNQSNQNGGALFTSTPLLLSQTEFRGNAAIADGGAVYANDTQVNDSLFLGNLAGTSGGALRMINDVGVLNSTFTGNRAAGFGGAIDYNFAPLRKGIASFLVNSIVWNNEDSSGVGTPSASINRNNQDFSVSFSLVEGSGGSAAWDPVLGFDGGGNLDVDPLFLQAVDLLATPTAAGDAHLDDGSPVLDAGDNGGVISAFDLDDQDRIQNGTVDMGSYEGTNRLFNDSFEQ